MKKLYNSLWINAIPTNFNFKGINLVRQKVDLRINFFVFILILFSINSSHAQSFATIGTGTTSTTSLNSDPIDGYFNFFRYQVVYTAAELTAAGMPAGAVIDQLGWSVNGDYGGGNMPNYTIRMALTAATNCATHNTATLTTVRNAANYNPAVVVAGSFDMIAFNTTFTWNGTSNILVDINAGSMSYTSPYGQVRTIAATTANGSRYVRCDGCGSQAASTTGTVNTTKPQVRFRYTVPTGCTGTPTGGTTVSSSNPVCSGTSFTLSTTGSTSASGLTYQWQSSSTGAVGSWANIAGATALTYTATQTVDTYYRLNITCTSSGLTGSSSALLVTATTCINMTNGSVTTCSGKFYDSGGAAGNYAANENFTYTINPGTAGAKVITTFNSATLEPSWDFLYVYDGTSTAATLLGTYSTITAGQVFQATTGNASGALTFRFTSDGSGQYTGWDATISCFLPPPCTGTPAPGNTLATANPVCPSISTTLSLQNTTTGTGVTYQWQSSPTGAAGSYTNVAGATSATYTTTVTSAIYYKCVVTCSAGPTSGTSNPILLTPDVLANCYCTNTNTTNTAYYISNVTTTGGITNINNSSGFSANGYGNYTAMSASQLQGGTVNFSINGAGSTYGYGIWIDYNQDGTFGAGEQVYNSGAWITSATGSFTVPLTALGGNTRMRVVLDYIATSPAACPGTTYSECEDYTFNVIAPPATPPTPTNITASPTCASGVTLTATGTPPAGVTWYWQGTNPSGTDNSAGANATTALTVFSNATYYIRAYNAALALWSTASASYTVTTVPSNAATAPAIVSSNASPACVTTNISSPTAISGTDYWQTTAAGTSTAASATTPYNGVTAGGTYYIRSIDGSGCWSAPSSYTLSVLPTPPGTVSATQIITCGGQGTLSINSAYYNNFNTTALGNATLYGNASLTGTVLQLNPNALSQNGAAVITDPNAINSNGMTIDFDLITLGAQGADGASYSFGDDVTVGLAANGECGSGTKLKLAFDAYTNGANTPGVYLMYNCATLSQAPTDPGVLAYSNNVSWCGGVTKHVTISIDNAGLATVSLGGTVLFSNIALGAGYLSANKATWKHAFAARTGGVAQGHQIDNINITYGYLVSPLEYSFDNATTWGTSNTTSVPVGTYNAWVRYASNPSCQFSAGSATINPFAVTPGTTVSSVATPCSAASFTLSLTGATTGAGVTYQWQSSPDGTTWSNIATATAATLTTTQTATTYYQCLVTCSGLTAASTSLQLNMGSTCLCAAYCAPTNGCGLDYISNVTFGTINRTSACDGGGYTSYATPNPSFTIGSTYSLSVSTGGDTEGATVWIDWNQNGIYDAAEQIFASYAGTNPATYTANVTIPSAALPGSTRMRVRCNYLAAPTDPCLAQTWGEAEDYCITLLALPVDAAVASITTNPTTVCAGATANTVSVNLINTGTTAIASGAVSVTLTVSGANSGTYTLTNSGALAYLASQTLNFTGVNLSNAGTNNLSATLTYTGDMVAGNNTTTSTLATQTGPAGVTANATPNTICSGGSGPIQLTSTAAAPTPPANANQYVFSTQTGVALSTLTAPINLIAANTDDGASAVTTIPFNFTFAGTTYTQFSVSSNGLMGLGGTVIPTLYTNTTVGFSTYPIIMPYWDDLYTATNGVNYQVLGTAPNRQLCIQWEVTNCCTGGTPDKTFQCWLLEGTNVVEFVYGAGATVTSPSVGISSASGNFNSVTTTSNTASTTAANDVNTAFPASGTAYLFSPPPHLYAWTPTANMTGSTIYNPSVSFVAAATTYTVTVTGSNGCASTATTSISVSNISASISSQTDVSCFGGSNADVTVVAANGATPYTYQLGTGVFQGNGFFSGLAVGTYTVTAKDANNCTYPVSVTITEPDSALGGNISIQNVSCINGANGSITVAGNGGTSPYQYKIDAGAYGASGTFSGLSAGSYTITIKDANNCTISSTETVIEPTSGVSASSSATPILCNGGGSTVTISAMGGTAPYTGTGTVSVTAGSYTYTVTDNNGCPSTTSINVTEPAVLNGSETPVDALCFGGNGSATISATGGTAPYTGTGTFSQLAGTQTYNISDANGCTASISATVAQPATPPTVNPISNISACPGQNIVLTFSGSAVVGTIYEWTVSNTAVGLAANGNGNINVVAPIVSGSSQVATITVTPNAGGCLGTPQTAQVTVLPKPSNPVAGLTTYCSDATMWVSTPVAGTIKWYNNNTGAGASVGIGATVPGFTSNGTYYAYEDLGGCMSDASNAVLVNVGMANHWSVIVNPAPPVTGTQVYYADAFCLDGNTGMKYYYNTAANMLLMASDYSIPAGVQLVTHTPTNATEMAVKVDIIAGYGSGTGQFVSGSTAPYVTSQFGWYVMHRTWQIEVAPVNQIPVGDSVRVKYFFSTLDEFDIFNSTGNEPDSFRFYKLRSGLDPSNPADHSGVDSSDIIIYDPSTVASLSTWVLGLDTVTNSQTADYYVSSFSGGGGGAGPGLNVSPLPVVLSSFKGENVGNENFLHWITEKELNTDHFEVERSSDKITYAKVGEVEANAQINGGERKYDFIDKYPLVGSNHYRLKVVDKNGAFNYSKSIELKYMPMKISFELYPNPMKDKLNVRIDGLPKDSKVRFTIYNLLGEKVFSDLWKEEGNIMKEVNVSQLAQGTYIYECVELKTGEVVKGKLTRTDL